MTATLSFSVDEEDVPDEIKRLLPTDLNFEIELEEIQALLSNLALDQAIENLEELASRTRKLHQRIWDCHLLLKGFSEHLQKEQDEEPEKEE